MRRFLSKGGRVVLAVAFGFTGRAQADQFGAGFRESMIGISLIAGSSALLSGVGTTASVSAGSTTLMAVAGIVAVLSGVSATSYMSSLSKALVMQLKIDHDTYLAGGERTPFLEEVYRGVLSESKACSRLDPATGMESINEEKMTEAIDKLVAMAEAQPLVQ